MKRIFALALSLLLICAATACKNAPAATEEQATTAAASPIGAPVLTAIIDRTQSGEIATADALEPFFSDENYTYFFPSIKSDYIECVFSDGSVVKFTDALADGKVSVSDLNAYGILYWAQDANGNITRGTDAGQ